MSGNRRPTADELIAKRRMQARGAVSTAYPPADTPDSAIDWPRIWGQLKHLHAQVRALKLENERLGRLLTEARGRAREAQGPPELQRSSTQGKDRTGHAGRTGAQSSRTPTETNRDSRPFSSRP